MAEGRIAQVVCQAGGGNDGANLGHIRRSQLRMAADQQACHIVAQRTAHARHLQAVRQPVVHKDAARQGKHLRLVLQAAEGGGEDQAVVVALKFRTVLGVVAVILLQAQALGRK